MRFESIGVGKSDINDLEYRLHALNINYLVDVRWTVSAVTYFKDRDLKTICQMQEIKFSRKKVLGNPTWLRKQYEDQTSIGDFSDLRLEYKSRVTGIAKKFKNVLSKLENGTDNSLVVGLLCSCPQKDVDAGICHSKWLKEVLDLEEWRNWNKQKDI